jgi:hypothetical protein
MAPILMNAKESNTVRAKQKLEARLHQLGGETS